MVLRLLSGRSLPFACSRHASLRASSSTPGAPPGKREKFPTPAFPGGATKRSEAQNVTGTPAKSTRNSAGTLAKSTQNAAGTLAKSTQNAAGTLAKNTQSATGTLAKDAQRTVKVPTKEVQRHHSHASGALAKEAQQHHNHAFGALAKNTQQQQQHSHASGAPAKDAQQHHNPPSGGSSSGGAASAGDAPAMAWSEFFRLRRRLQLMKRFAGIPFVFAFWAAEGMILSLPIFDPTKTILQLDPMVVVGLATIAGSAASYFVGAATTGLVWRMFRPAAAKQLDLKQKDFYARITKHRANVPPNPTQMNFNFDYYGEKVRSVADYRAWLRRQQRLLADRHFPVE